MTPGDRSRERGTRGVVREIDEQLNRLNKEEKAIKSEREALLAARAALTGRAVGKPQTNRRVSGEEIEAYLREHPGSMPRDIAKALGVPATNIATHLNRGKGTRFTRQEDGWAINSRTG